MSAEYGFVYVLSNDSMPNCYKIGFSTKHPMLRAVELSTATGCPTPFKIFTYFGCENPMVIEKTLHSYFSEFRINNKREFFSLEDIQIHEAIALICENFKVDEVTPYYDHVDAMLMAWKKSLADEEKWKLNHYLEQSIDASDMDFRRVGFK